MAAYKVYNSTAATLLNINSADEDVLAYSVLDPVTLTSSELAGVLNQDGVAAVKSTNTAAEVDAIISVMADGGAGLTAEGDGTADGSVENTENDYGYYDNPLP